MKGASQQERLSVASYGEKHQQQLKYKANILNGDVTSFLQSEHDEKLSKQNKQQITNGNQGKKEEERTKQESSQRVRSASSNQAKLQKKNSKIGKDEGQALQSNQAVLRKAESKEKIQIAERQLSSQSNGMGLWVHQPNKGFQNENLPPIHNNKKGQFQQNQQKGGSQRTVIADVDAKIEKNMNQFLEKKYQETAQQLDQAEMLREKAQFECDMAKIEKDKYLEMLKQSTDQLAVFQQKCNDQEQKMAQLIDLQEAIKEENQKLSQQYESSKKSSEQYQKMYIQEAQSKETSNNQLEIKLKDLEEQLAEYEEENMNLQNQLYQQRMHYDQIISKQNASQQKASASKSDSKFIEEEKQVNFEEDKGNELNDEGEMDEKSKKITELMKDLILMRKRLKKEEESRRQYQEISRKKEDEVKKLRFDISNLDKKLNEEENAKNRERNLVMQKENKIKVLEERLRTTDMSDAKKISQNPKAHASHGFKKNMKQKEVKEEAKDKIVKFKDIDKGLNEKNWNIDKQLKNDDPPDFKCNIDEEFGDLDEELQPVKARPFLFGPIDRD